MKIQVLLSVVWLLQSCCYAYRSSVQNSDGYAFKETYYWTIPDFEFPDSTARDMALETGSYIPENNVIYCIRAWREKIFASVFRLKTGVASSFNYFFKNSGTKSPALIPYPSYDDNYVSAKPKKYGNGITSESSIVSAAYFNIDKCNRLWVVDTGIDDFFGARRVVTEPAILIFDLKTDSLIRRYRIPDEFVNSVNSYTYAEIELRGDDCNDAYAYLSDMLRSIVVYSFRKDRSWRLTHNYLAADPEAGNFYYQGVNFQWHFGILGIKVGEQCHDGSRRVYLKPFASTKTYYISNKVLQNERYLASHNYFYDVRRLGDRGRKGHVYEYAFDEKTNVLFDVQFNKRRIGCWNTATPYRNSSFAVLYESHRDFFPIDISVDHNRNVWVVTNNYPIFAHGPWDTRVKNMRVYKAKADDAISGTVCDGRNGWRY